MAHHGSGVDGAIGLNSRDETLGLDNKIDIAIGESAELSDNSHHSRGHGSVVRGLKSRHLQFIAMGGSIGTGLFLGIGAAFRTSGPASVLIGYIITGIAVYVMMCCLGEMTTWLPLPGAIPQYCHRYVDPALGFAIGWHNWYSNCLSLCTEISASAVIISYWNDTTNPAVWITVIIVIVLSLNTIAVSIYGEAEFVFASIKILAIIGLLILSLVIDLGGAPKQDRLGFRYWIYLYEAMKSSIGSGDIGRFLGVFIAILNGVFSFAGIEMVAVAAGETRDPRRNIPRAVRRVFWRILFFYVLGALAIGVTVPENDPLLLDPGVGAAGSPWVIAILRAVIPALPSIMNAVILTPAASSANAFLYTGSRYLFALAQNKHAPAVLLYCTKRGVPLWCVLITASFGSLTYMTTSAGSAVVFDWFKTITTITSAVAWCSILVAYLGFRAACTVQRVDSRTLPFRSRFQPHAAWCTLVFFVVMILFNGFAVFTKGHWNVKGLFTSYVDLPIYLSLFVFWKVFKRTKLVDPSNADIHSGKGAIDAIVWPEPNPRNWLQKVWYLVV